MRIRPSLTLIAVAVILSLAGCGKPTLTGTFVARGTDRIEMMQFVQAQNGEISGQLEVMVVGADGKITNVGASVTGSADGKNVSLTFKANGLIGDSFVATGSLEGDKLSLIHEVPNNGPVTTVLTRSDLADFQKGVADLKGRSEQILAARAEAEAKAKAERERQAAAQAEADAKAQLARNRQAMIQDLTAITGRVEAFAKRADQSGPRAAEIVGKFQAVTTSMQTLLEQERRQVGYSNSAVNRGQLSVKINQQSVAMEQMHIELENSIQDLDNTSQTLASDVGAAEGACKPAHEPTAQNPIETEALLVNRACLDFRNTAATFRSKSLEAGQAIQAVEGGYQREYAKQQQIVQESTRIE